MALHRAKTALKQNTNTKLWEKAQSKNSYSAHSRLSKKPNSICFRGKKDGQWYTVIIDIDKTWLDVPGLNEKISKILFDQDCRDVGTAIERYKATFEKTGTVGAEIEYPYMEISLTESTFHSADSFAVLYAGKKFAMENIDFGFVPEKIFIDKKTRRMVGVMSDQNRQLR